MNNTVNLLKYNFRQTYVLYKKELKSYVGSPILYIIMTVFLLLTGVLFFKDFYAIGRADMRSFFNMLPFFFMLLIPAITMRQIAEERSKGTLEMVVTMPVTTSNIVTGKFFASLIVVLLMMLPTLLYVVSLGLAGAPDYGMIVAGYIGTVFLAAAYVAAGIFASSLTHNQIIAWLIATAICVFFTMIDFFIQYIPGKFFAILNYLSASFHFQSLAKGVLEFRDIIYFVTVSLFFMILSVRSIEERR
ncbi:MAG: ABC transporter permease subunit [Spirochaetes bacterium]|jgi:ABC-2 type transport system permease protein|nr:ABC transporter permease subunit [Spirochaetota bacterium]